MSDSVARTGNGYEHNNGSKLALTVTVARSIFTDLSNLWRALLHKAEGETPPSQDPLKAPIAGCVERWRRLAWFINTSQETMKFTDYIYAEAQLRCANELSRALERIPKSWSESQVRAALREARTDEVFFISELCTSYSRDSKMLHLALRKRLAQLKGELR
ncbi:MAG TPA: hypothetical protein VNB49_02380 [Candidatus Dormibacteraeota bacterium]|nr:hypothetical protein [Candidatus Dormibacteraeota bacterium]